MAVCFQTGQSCKEAQLELGEGLPEGAYKAAWEGSTLPLPASVVLKAQRLTPLAYFPFTLATLL